MNDRMAATAVGRVDYERRGEESAVSAVSWGAVLGGAFAAAALSLILLSLGSGLVSPRCRRGRTQAHRRRRSASQRRSGSR